MNLMTRIHMEVIKKDASGNDASFVFSMPFGSSYQDCYDSAIEIANKIVELSKAAQEQEKKNQEENSHVEEPQGV